MKAVIVGCGRVGATLADQLDRSGHQVVILDVSSAAFDRLPSSFGGSAIRGDGTDEDVLRRAGTEGADMFLALTEGDNRNVMAAQLAAEALGVQRTIAKINDPVRAEAYGHLGIAALCRTNLMIEAVLSYLGFQPERRPGIITPERSHHEHPHAVGAGVTPGTPLGSTTADPAASSAAAPAPVGGTADSTEA
jgi:trk system potassium uptake protein TrkA